MKFKKIVGLLVISSLVLILSACGKADNKKEVTMGEMFHSKGEKVYFDIEKGDHENKTLSKANFIERIIVTKDGKLTSYNVKENSPTLADLEKKSTSDIVKLAKKEDKKTHDASAKEYPFYRGYGYSEPKFRKVKINVETDDSGNHTKEEGLYIKSPYDIQMDESIKQPDEKDMNRIYNSFEMTIPPTEIKDSKFAGLENDEHFFVTKVGNKVEKIKFDEPDSKYVDKVDGEKKDK